MSIVARQPRRVLRYAIVVATLLAPFAAIPVRANNYGESSAWQFETPNEIAAQAALRDLIARHRGGVYAAPVYTTNIARQYSCSVAATATGNSGAQSAVANSPSVAGAASSAVGNSNAATVAGDDADPWVTSGQLNGGPVTSTLVGSTTTLVDGSASQALNSTQSNGGDQQASVTDARACAFGVLN